jgi:formyl-CoA transferase
VLADLGADVIKVEDPAGEVSRRVPPFLPGASKPISFLQATVNRNKRSLTLDLRTPEGRDIFLALTRRADIVVQNFRPGTFDKWGVGYHNCRAVKPDIIYISISGFGLFGPISDRVGYDPLAQAMSGFMSLNGPVDGGPSKAPTFLCDDLAGLHGAIAALGALQHRARTGEGSIAMCHCWMPPFSNPMAIRRWRRSAFRCHEWAMNLPSRFRATPITAATG